MWRCCGYCLLPEGTNCVDIQTAEANRGLRGWTDLERYVTAIDIYRMIVVGWSGI
jgi:hypothetical protein